MIVTTCGAFCCGQITKNRAVPAPSSSAAAAAVMSMNFQIINISIEYYIIKNKRELQTLLCVCVCVGVKRIINQRECAQPSVRYRKERKRWRPIGDDGLIDTIQAFAGLTLVDCHHSKIRRRGRPPTYTAVARDSRRISIHPSILVFLFFYTAIYSFLSNFSFPFRSLCICWILHSSFFFL